MCACAESGGKPIGGEHGTDRKSAAQCFGAGQNVWCDAVFHIRVQRAGAADAGLYLIKNQQRTVAVTQLTQPLQESRVRRQHAAFALNRLDDHGTGLVVDRCCSCGQIVERYMLDAEKSFAYFG